MASLPHLANKIPWKDLASHFQWVSAKQVSRPKAGAELPFNGDLQPRCLPGQGDQIRSFVNAMVTTLREHSKTYRGRYPEPYEPADPDDIILDDVTVRKIAPTVSRWSSGMSFLHNCDSESVEAGHVEALRAGGVCPHRPGILGECRCPIPHDERRAAAFYREHVYNNCYEFEDVNGKAFYNLELVKTLLLYGGMDIVLRVCLYPKVDLDTWHDIGPCYCVGSDAGWNLLYQTALLPYMALNLIHCFPETWDRAVGGTDEKDYRQMRIYRVMIRTFTEAKASTSEVGAYPHLDFFDLNQRSRQGSPDQPENPLDQGEEPLTRETSAPDSGTHSDTVRAQQILLDCGLPLELVLTIMETAEYGDYGPIGPTAKLAIPDDPFHPANGDELAKYVEFCWQLLVRCDMMATAIGMAIPWHDLISYTIAYQLIGEGPDGKEWFTTDYAKGLEGDDTHYTFL